MFYKTRVECEELCRIFGVEQTIDASDAPMHGAIRLSTTGTVAPFMIAKLIVDSLGNFSSCLLWVTEYGIWPHSQNDHLYYRLRTSYGDTRELQAAPGHFFLGYESSDLITFLDVAIQFGWGAHIVCPPNWTCSYVLLSHDGWIRIKCEPAHRQSVIDSLQVAEIPYELED